MKIKSVSGNPIIIDVLPEDEALVLEYLKCRKLEIAALTLFEDKLISGHELNEYTSDRQIVEFKYNKLLFSRILPTQKDWISFVNFYWELDED
jgi:hypothetical protein